MLLPELPDGVADAVARISIRGRMALGARCFDDACAHFGVDDAETRALSSSFWSYVDAEDLGVWESEVPDGLGNVQNLMMVTVDPAVTLGPAWANTPDPTSQVLPAYARMPLGLVIMAVLIYDDIGRGNLYSGVRDHSPTTWLGTLRVLGCMRQMGLPIPDLQPFLRSSFAEDGGWGDPRPRVFFAPEG